MRTSVSETHLQHPPTSPSVCVHPSVGAVVYTQAVAFAFFLFIRGRRVSLRIFAALLALAPGVAPDTAVEAVEEPASRSFSRCFLFHSFCLSWRDRTSSLGLPAFLKACLVQPFFLQACLCHVLLSGLSHGQGFWALVFISNYINHI